jgi:hypothetical protein
MSDAILKAGFDHPCRETCSGWAQGKQRGEYDSKVKIANLEHIIRETLWMARRYAHKRQTFAPTTVNECIELALKMGVEIAPDTVDGIELFADDGGLGKWLPEHHKFEKEGS